MSAHRTRQYFGPTNSSSLATASRRATEIVVGFENRQATPSRSSASPHSRCVSGPVDEQVPRVPAVTVLERAPHPVDKPATVGVKQPAGEIAGMASDDLLLPGLKLDFALVLASRPVPCPAARRCRATAFSTSTSALSCADPMCSMSRYPRWDECTICTAVAPDAVFTARTYGTRPPCGPG